MSAEVYDNIIKDLQAKKAASLGDIQKNRPVIGHRVEVDLGKTLPEPLLVNFPFQSVMVMTSTDTSCSVNVQPVSKEDTQPAFTMTTRDSWYIPYQIPRAYLTWPVQPGKKMVLMFFADSEFRSGQQISTTSGGLSISDGSTMTTAPQVPVGTTVTKILSADMNRKVANLYNAGTQTVWLGDATVTTGNGIPFLAGESRAVRNSGELYGISSVAGQNINIMIEAG